MFFVEKKNQKTFASLWLAVRTQALGRESFLLLFFKKEGLSFSWPTLVCLRYKIGAARIAAGRVSASTSHTGKAIVIMMKVSVSRSVARAFSVLELFRKTQEPANASQISRRLDAPHSSVVAILKNLCELGFLTSDEMNMTYFPTTKLRDLTSWLRSPAKDHGHLGGLVDSLARDTGHMTALSSRLSLFVNTVVQRTGRFSAVSAPPASVGAALIDSVCGHVILAQLDDNEVAGIMRKSDDWLRNAGARKSFDKARTLANIDLVRRNGFLSGTHSTCRSTEIIAYAVKGPASSPLALSVHIPSCLSRGSKEEIRLLLEGRVSERHARMSPHTNSIRRPEAVLRSTGRPHQPVAGFT